MNELTRAELISQDMRIAAGHKTSHLCMKFPCAECDRNTQIQMARNRVAELHRPVCSSACGHVIPCVSRKCRCATCWIF